MLLPWNGEQFEIDIKLQRFSASSIGLIETGLSILANANVLLEGDAHTTISRTGELGVTEFSFAGSDGEVALPDLMKAPLPIKALLVAGPASIRIATSSRWTVSRSTSMARSSSCPAKATASCAAARPTTARRC